MDLVLEPYDGSSADRPSEGPEQTDCLEGRTAHDWFTLPSAWDGPLIWEACSFCHKRRRKERAPQKIFIPAAGCSRTGY